MFDKDNVLTNSTRHQNFFVFDPGSIRVSESDIFLIGQPVVDMYEEAMSRISKDLSDIKVKILYNKLQKIGHMLDLLNSYDNVIISKFFDRIWRRYSHITHLGEPFFDLKTFLNYFPEYNDKLETVTATRLDFSSEFEDEDLSADSDDSDDSNDSDDSDDSNKSNDNTGENTESSNLTASKEDSSK